MRTTGLAIGALVAVLLAAGCEGDGGGASDVGGGADVAATPDGTGPPAACGGIGAGTFVAGGGVTSEGDDSVKLRVGVAGRPLDLTVRMGTDTVMLGFMNETVVAGDLPRWGADDRTILIGPIRPDTTNAAVSGAVFQTVNEGFGGNIVEGRLCFDASPATGQPLAGSWVFVLALGAEDALHRVQGTFAIPGDAVTRTDDALEILATGATVTLD